MRQESWLIIGGAGYVGAHIADLFLTNNKKVVIADSLVNGSQSRITYLNQRHDYSIPFFKSDIRDAASMYNLITEIQPTGIILTAALKSVSESFDKPDEYMNVNHISVSHIISAAVANNVSKIFFSSSAAVYGSPNQVTPLQESDSTNPISPYGLSKLKAEKEIQKFLNLPGKNGACFRYFNVVGTAQKELADYSGSNLVPIVLNQIKNKKKTVIYGRDYPTEDGTCIRDYIDVRDIAAAHLISANHDSKLPSVMNLGSENGKSVLEVVKQVYVSHGLEMQIEFRERRFGDPTQIVSDSRLIKKELGHTNNFSIEESIESLVE